MMITDLTLAIFTFCNSVRIVAYIPQILKAANDRNGASAISYTTWGLFFVSHGSTVAYAIINMQDWAMACISLTNAACCLAILGIAAWNWTSYAARSQTVAGNVTNLREWCDAKAAQAHRPAIAAVRGTSD